MDKNLPGKSARKKIVVNQIQALEKLKSVPDDVIVRAIRQTMEKESHKKK